MGEHSLVGVVCGAVAVGAIVACGLELAGSDPIGLPNDDAGTEEVEAGGLDATGDAEVWLGCTSPSLQRRAAWPALGGCSTRAGQSGIRGPILKPTRVWSANLAGYYKPTPVIARDDTIYVATNDNGLASFHPDGGPARPILSGAGNVTNTPTIDRVGTIFFGRTPHVVAWMRDGGQWSVDITGEVDTSPMVDSEGNVYAGSHADRFWSMTSTGDVRWKKDNIGRDVWSSAAIGPNGDIYVGLNTDLQAFQTDGGTAWTAPTGVIESSPIVGDDGTIYVGTTTSKLFAFAPNGTKRWEMSTPGPFPWQVLPALGRDGLIYAASGQRLEARKQSDGTVVWSVDLQANVFVSVVVDAAGVIYTGGGGNKIVAVSPDGVQRWSINTAEAPWGVAFTSNGTMIVACDKVLEAWR